MKINFLMVKSYSLFLFFLFSLFSFLLGQEIKSDFKKEITKKVELQYILDIPKDLKKEIPIIVFLHGSGERGTNLELVKGHSPFTYKDKIKEQVAILAPQCPENTWWNTEAVYELIKEIISKYKIDKKRVYLTGLSMGGWGTWKLAEEHSELFAAIAPVCAPVDRTMTYDYNINNLKTMPIQIYHGALDDDVPTAQSIEIYQALKKINTNVNITIYPNDNHNSWDSTYSNPKFYEWLFSNYKL